MNREIYDDILDNFELYFPEIAKDAVGWHPSGRNTITVRLRNGDSVLFDDIMKTSRHIRKRDDQSLTEDEWRYEFKSRLAQILRHRGISQERLSELTGITQAMISRYITGKSVPSAYTITKIAQALECSPIELTEF